MSVFTLIITLLLTLLLYGAVPMGFSLFRKKPIKPWVYIVLSYGLNFVIYFIIVWISSSANPSPYVVWTSTFVYFGKNRLEDNGLLKRK